MIDHIPPGAVKVQPTSVLLDDLLPSTDASQAAEFVRIWFKEIGPNDKVIITRISSGGRHVVKSWALSRDELIESFSGGIDSLCQDGSGLWNVYFSCSVHGCDPTRGGSSRGGKNTIGRVEGVWLDLDVKDDSFASGEEIDDFIKTLPFQPTIVVNSGTGGRHCYWRFSDGPVPRDEGEQLNRGWWAFVQELAGSAYVDQVADSTRVMRLPGTIRWPKEGGEMPSQVVMLTSDGPEVSRYQIRDAVAGAVERDNARRAATRRELEESVASAGVELDEISSMMGWDRLLAMGYLEEIFNRSITWERILAPHGWQQIRTDYEGRVHWARPGRESGTSGTTDYPASPHVMTLFSNAVETRLGMLSDAGVPLTKFRVHCQLSFGGDMQALIREILKERGV